MVSSYDDTIIKEDNRPKNTVEERVSNLNTDNLSVFDFDEMGVVLGKKTTVDATELFKALQNGMVKVKFSAFGLVFKWNVLAIEITENGKTYMVFTGTFFCDGNPAFFEVFVYNDSIDIEMKVLSATDFLL